MIAVYLIFGYFIGSMVTNFLIRVHGYYYKTSSFETEGRLIFGSIFWPIALPIVLMSGLFNKMDTKAAEVADKLRK